MSFAPPNQPQSQPQQTAPVIPPPPHPPAPNPAAFARSTSLPGFDTDPTQPGQFGGTAFPGAASAQPARPPFQPAPGAGLAPMSTPSRRSGTSALVMALIIIGPVVAISATVWAVLRSRDAAEQAERESDRIEATVDSVIADAEDAIDDLQDDIEVSIPDVTLPAVPVVPVDGVDASIPAVTLPTVTTPVETPTAAASLFDPAGATAVIGTFEAAIGGAPTKMMRVVMYPGYAFATAQDPANALHVDEYEYRDGFVGLPSPVTLVGDGDLESNLFATTDVDWTFISRAVSEAPSLLPAVEEGEVTHVIVERSVFTPDFSVTVRVYVSGPRGGGYVEYTPTGEFIQVVA